MRVKLRNQLFVANRLFERGEHKDFPDELKKHLPKSATTEFEDEKPAAPASADYRDLDIDRVNGDQLDKIETGAEARRAANAKKIRDRLAAETTQK